MAIWLTPPERPSLYVSPVNKRVFDPSPVVTVSSDMYAVFAQDRIDIGDHWTLSIGLRVDDQAIENDTRTEVNSYNEVVPRFSVVCDVNADGRLLVRGTAGRYYRAIGLGIVLQEFTSGNNGENTYDQFLWNPATLAYDRFQRRVEPAAGGAGGDVVPYYKDEVSAGFDWQFSDNWTFKTRAVVSEADNIFHGSLQYDAAGAVVRDLRNWSDARRGYEGISFELNRAFRNLIGKVNFQPSGRHQISVTAIDSPSTALGGTAAAGDIFAAMDFPMNGRIQTGTWSFAATNSVFSELKLSNKEEFVGRIPTIQHPIDPNASPDDPAGNNFRYRDLSDGARFNGPAVRLGPGFNDFPRDTANASVTVFKGNHELKFGGDVQQIEFSQQGAIETEFRGRNYCDTCPGG